MNSSTTPMLYDSPLHTLLGKVLFAIIAIIVGYMSLTIWTTWVAIDSNTWKIPAAILLAVAISLPAIVFLRWLDRRDPEPWWIYILVVALSVLVFAPCAAFVNNYSPIALLTVPPTEEFFKISLVLIIVYFFPTVITGVRDGMIFGGLSGLGFNCLEFMVYLLKDTGDFSQLEGQLNRMGVLGIDNHVVWTMLIGAGIGYAVQAEDGARKWLVPIGAFVLAMITHYAQDILIGAIIMASVIYVVFMAFGFSREQIDAMSADESLASIGHWQLLAGPFETLIINIFNIALLVFASAKSGNWERSVVAEQLSTESGDVVTPGDLAGAQAERRFHLRKTEAPTAAIGREIRRTQNALAFHKEYLRRRSREASTDVFANALRARIFELRAHA